MIKVANKYLLGFSPEKSAQVAKLVGKAGFVEVIENQENNQNKSDLAKKLDAVLQSLEYKIASFDFAVSYLSPFVKKQSFFNKIKNPKIILSKNEKSGFDSNHQKNLLAQVKTLEDIEKKTSQYDKEEKDTENKLIDLEKFGCLDFIPQDTAQTTSFLVCLSQNNVLNFEETAKENKWHCKALSHIATKQAYFLLVNVEDKEKAKEIIKDNKAEILQYGFSREPQEQKRIFQARLKEIDRERAFHDKKIKEIAKNFSDFKICRDLIAIRKNNLEVKKLFFKQGLLNYLVFWGYERDVLRLYGKLRKMGDVFLVDLSSEQGEEPPVAMENNRFLRPFQYVTEIFGMPRGDEVDPTPYLALFFILFFGVCLTDAGYGVLLIVFTILPLLFLKKLFTDNKLMLLLFYGGISTLIMGVLFGSYFGATTAFLQAKAPWLLKLKKIDPIEDTVLFMIIAFSLGFLQVFFAQIVKIITGFKKKDRAMALGGLTWAFFYIAAVVGTAVYLLLDSKIVFLVIIGAALLLLLASESLGIKLFLKPLVGCIKILQGLIGTVSDILSYSRLVALGLATSVIALIVNQIAFLLGSMIPYVGFLLTGLILIGGHIFNLGINALGAFIHSGRLQFVEFFPKFLEGGGRRMQPLKADVKYIET